MTRVLGAWATGRTKSPLTETRRLWEEQGWRVRVPFVLDMLH